tara:strand:+ start:60 stop:518 length:459 start_codon:yes stop_codon:yes gene_type:complete
MSKNPINQSGAKAEEKFENCLREHNFTYKKHPIPPQKANGSKSKLKIDFIVDLADGNRMLIEISNQNEQGTANEKLPHKFAKYVRIYEEDIYLVRGKKPLPKEVKISLNDACRIYSMDYKKPIRYFDVTMEEMLDILKGNNPVNNSLRDFFG